MLAQALSLYLMCVAVQENTCEHLLAQAVERDLLHKGAVGTEQLLRGFSSSAEPAVSPVSAGSRVTPTPGMQALRCFHCST